ncbi:hypothetical protein BJ912DRAFT_1149906 [Pholiota molesta]|nr:hypothetical protein BJ912DRAFT_1149906 [Pholiota molesta]
MRRLALHASALSDGEYDLYTASLHDLSLTDEDDGKASKDGEDAYFGTSNFIGSNSFCLKACDPAGPNAAHFCEHIYDRIGCAYNAPNAARDRVFESCDGEDQDFLGVYTAPNGTTLTYHQPPESLGPITTIAYTARVPASSNCQVFESAALYTGLPSAVAASTSTTGVAGATAATGSVRPGATTGSAAAAAQATNTSGASSLTVSAYAVVGVVLAAVLLA